jgi:23S rRNA pseudouridine1911/1915/1917 synthase
MSGRLIPVPEGLVGERVDIALTRLLGLSRSRAASLADAGAVEISGVPVGKGDRIPADAVVWIDLAGLDEPEPASATEEPVPGLAVLYEDAELVVVDKPIGVAAHPSPGWSGPTVIGGLAAAGFAVATSGAAERQGIVHRLDVGTSGAMVVAKSERAYASLKQQFRERSVDKTYHAVVQGLLDPTAGTIDAPVGRHPTQDYRFAVVSGGKSSVTHYVTMEAFAHASLVEVTLETGRTHQIRVHMAAMRHPCAGDLTYGADPVLAQRLGLSRQWLHAVRLGFEHPVTGERIVVVSEPPEDLRVAVARLRSGA